LVDEFSLLEFEAFYKFFNSNSKFIELVENGVTLNLTVVDTPGFGDQLNREHKYVTLINS